MVTVVWQWILLNDVENVVSSDVINQVSDRGRFDAECVILFCLGMRKEWILSNAE